MLIFNKNFIRITIHPDSLLIRRGNLKSARLTKNQAADACFAVSAARSEKIWNEK